MTLSSREKVLIVISNAISVYSIYAKDPNTLPKNMSLIDFILKATPEDLRKGLSMELIDEVFAFVSQTQAELS